MFSARFWCFVESAMMVTNMGSVCSNNMQYFPFTPAGPEHASEMISRPPLCNGCIPTSCLPHVPGDPRCFRMYRRSGELRAFQHLRRRHGRPRGKHDQHFRQHGCSRPDLLWTPPELGGVACYRDHRVVQQGRVGDVQESSV